MPRFTDEQVDAARMALPAFSFPTPSQMRAALNAAAEAAPAVDTTEFEDLLARYDDWNYSTRRRHEFRHGLIRMFREAAR